MQIINKTKDKMCDYALHIANCNSRYFSRTDIGDLFLILIEDDDCLVATIGWKYFMKTIAENKFEKSEDGFNKACGWFDNMRIEFVKKLL